MAEQKKAPLAEVTAKRTKPYAPVDHSHRGELKNIPIDHLVIPTEGDGGYQRDEVPGHPAKIATEFDWHYFGALSVLKRLDRKGEMQVADGGNRLRAAKLRGDIETVPCSVVPIHEDAQAAAIFAKINTDRKALAFAITHRAMKMAGDQDHLNAAVIFKQLNEAGVSFTSIKALTKECKRTASYAAVKRLIPLFIELGHQGKDGHINTDLFKGMVLLECDIAPDSLTTNKNRKKLITIGVERLSDFSGLHFGRHPNAFARVLRDKLKYRPNPYSER
ncbi:MAG TPA: ParB N-terminal domain-containing protein [Candidatus Saccharimonadales bacterium]|nr:ParB N-terminal domain-containing protein [Candidatus Saccharimonadales bacterium]